MPRRLEMRGVEGTLPPPNVRLNSPTSADGASTRDEGQRRGEDELMKPNAVREPSGSAAAPTALPS
ncbi:MULTISPECIES: hypothetical protein [Bradyrhizobium]|uniref:hypothetical protein n=1 Tax=Bradyrhizobium TaxID=374 RepID=UPI0004BC915B|nr:MULTISPECIES: hypothetical protein [Bradyrhizobium]MCA1376956.1 hypothetical protein [Bradyrhizobium sp. IC4060]MCA1390499.1 hypothetical protein [Bradyrhizobium sp. IC3123]MCA1437041.1 hypothetical protein [Bradyrhizobium sp. BRP20]MCA1471744.1 hypothetical protein [Bradyrhizobium sp. IC3195]MCA1476513.1 hypothetical protein [Bradyrhizobium sp. NBAIM08]